MAQAELNAVHSLAAASITVAGIATGLHFEILLAGFAGSLASLSYLNGMSLAQRSWSLFTSTITAGYIAPTLANKMSADVDNLGVSVFSGFVIGLVAQVLIPGMLRLAKSRLAKYEAKSEKP